MKVPQTYRGSSDDDAVQHLIDDAGEVLHAIIKCITDGLAAQGGHAQAQHEGQHHGRQGVQQRRDGDGDVAGQRVVSRGGDLFQSAFAHEAGEQACRHQIGCRACDQGGAVGQSHRDEQQLACAALQVGNAHGDVGHDHQRDDELQERAEDAGCRDDDPAEPHRKNWPMMMPSTMAMSSFGSSPSLNFFFSIRIKSSFSYSDLCAAPDSALSAAARTASLSRNVKFSLDVLTHLV